MDLSDSQNIKPFSTGEDFNKRQAKLMYMTVVKTEELKKEFGDLKALEDVSFEIGEGEIVGILGANGAGKSTLMKILSGQYSRDGGDVEVLAQDPEKNSAELKEELGILPEREDPPSFLTGKEFLDFCAEVRGEDIVESKWVDRLNLGDDLQKLTQDLSKGERQKLMIAQAFLHKPELVLIDEPLINLDPFIQEEAKNIFREHRDNGGTVFLSTHVISPAEELCDRVLFLEEGEIVEKIDEVENLKAKFLKEE